MFIKGDKGLKEKDNSARTGDMTSGYKSKQSSPEKTILVVDDEPHLVDAMALTLNLEGYRVMSAYTGREALSKIKSELPDLVTLDIMMPQMNGFEVLEQIRRKSSVPVIMITVMGKETDKVKALDLGADDYVTKPFHPSELVARIKAVIRRVEVSYPLIERIRVDNRLTIDFPQGKVFLEGREILLRPTENRLLHQLITNAGHVLSSESLLQTVWGHEYIDQNQYLWTYITHLRRLIEEDPEKPAYILSWRGTGYQFRNVSNKHKGENT